MSAQAENPSSVTAPDPIAASPVYPAGSRVNPAGHLEIAGCDVERARRELVERVRARTAHGAAVRAAIARR